MSALNRHFARHYLVMVAVMFVGMAVLGVPAELGLNAVGSSWSDLHENAPAAMLALMCFTMTAPMVAWMKRMGHGRRANVEMALAMIVPTLAVIALLGAGLLAGDGGLMLIEHVAMLAAMFGVMLLRPEEYSRPHRHHEAVAA